MRSVRLPIVVPHRESSTRMGSAIECSLRFRGPPVAAGSVMPRGVQTVSVVASSRPGAGCVNRHPSLGHQVPRSRSSSSRQPRGLARSLVISGSSVQLGGDCRCGLGKLSKFAHSHRGSSFQVAAGARVRSANELNQVPSTAAVRQPNYAFERTVMWRRDHRRCRAAAQRER